ncbi:MAG: hypothetical protein AAGJ87_13505 [Pseudomonadota bacterium]
MMRHSHAAEYSANALAAIWGGLAVAASAAKNTAIDHMPNNEAYQIALAGCVVGGLIAVVATSGWRERIATFIASLGFGISLGPFVADLIAMKNGFSLVEKHRAVFALSLAWALVGWPVYKLVRAVFAAGDANAAGIGGFIGVLISAFLDRRK